MNKKVKFSFIVQIKFFHYFDYFKQYEKFIFYNK